jgi:hypothetical protein
VEYVAQCDGNRAVSRERVKSCAWVLESCSGLLRWTVAVDLFAPVRSHWHLDETPPLHGALEQATNNDHELARLIGRRGVLRSAGLARQGNGSIKGERPPFREDDRQRTSVHSGAQAIEITLAQITLGRVE